MSADTVDKVDADMDNDDRQSNPAVDYIQKQVELIKRKPNIITNLHHM